MTRGELIKEQESQEWIFTGKELNSRDGRWKSKEKGIFWFTTKDDGSLTIKDDDVFYINFIPNENEKVILHDHFAGGNASLEFLMKFRKKKMCSF